MSALPKLNLKPLPSGGGWGLGDQFARLPNHQDQLKAPNKTIYTVRASDAFHDSDEGSAGSPRVSGVLSAAALAEVPNAALVARKNTTGSNGSEIGSPSYDGDASPKAQQYTASTDEDDNTIVDHTAPAKKAPAPAPAQVVPAVNVAVRPWRTAAEAERERDDIPAMAHVGRVLSTLELPEGMPCRSMALVNGKNLWVAVGADPVAMYDLAGCDLNPQRSVATVMDVTAMTVVNVTTTRTQPGGHRSSTRQSGGPASRATSQAQTSELSSLWCGLERGSIALVDLFFFSDDGVIANAHSDTIHFMYTLPYTTGGCRVWTASRDRHLRVWDGATRKPMTRKVLNLPVTDCCAIAPEVVPHVWTTSGESCVRVWDYDGRERTSTRFPPNSNALKFKAEVRFVRFHASTQLMWVCLVNSIVLMNPKTYEVLQSLPVAATTLEFSPHNTHTAIIIGHYTAESRQRVGDAPRVIMLDFPLSSGRVGNDAAFSLTRDMVTVGQRVDDINAFATPVGAVGQWPGIRLFTNAPIAVFPHTTTDDKIHRISLFAIESSEMLQSWGMPASLPRRASASLSSPALPPPGAGAGGPSTQSSPYQNALRISTGFSGGLSRPPLATPNAAHTPHNSAAAASVVSSAAPGGPERSFAAYMSGLYRGGSSTQSMIKPAARYQRDTDKDGASTENTMIVHGGASQHAAGGPPETPPWAMPVTTAGTVRPPAASYQASPVVPGAAPPGSTVAPLAVTQLLAASSPQDFNVLKLIQDLTEAGRAMTEVRTDAGVRRDMASIYAWAGNQRERLLQSVPDTSPAAVDAAMQEAQLAALPDLKSVEGRTIAGTMAFLCVRLQLLEATIASRGLLTGSVSGHTPSTPHTAPLSIYAAAQPPTPTGAPDGETPTAAAAAASGLASSQRLHIQSLLQQNQRLRQQLHVHEQGLLRIEAAIGAGMQAVQLAGEASGGSGQWSPTALADLAADVTAVQRAREPAPATAYQHAASSIGRLAHLAAASSQWAGSGNGSGPFSHDGWPSGGQNDSIASASRRPRRSTTSLQREWTVQRPDMTAQKRAGLMRTVVTPLLSAVVDAAHSLEQQRVTCATAHRLHVEANYGDGSAIGPVPPDITAQLVVNDLAFVQAMAALCQQEATVVMLEGMLNSFAHQLGDGADDTSSSQPSSPLRPPQADLAALAGPLTTSSSLSPAAHSDEPAEELPAEALAAVNRAVSELIAVAVDLEPIGARLRGTLAERRTTTAALEAAVRADATRAAPIGGFVALFGLRAVVETDVRFGYVRLKGALFWTHLWCLFLADALAVVSQALAAVRDRTPSAPAVTSEHIVFLLERFVEWREFAEGCTRNIVGPIQTAFCAGSVHGGHSTPPSTGRRPMSRGEKLYANYFGLVAHPPDASATASAVDVLVARPGDMPPSLAVAARSLLDDGEAIQGKMTAVLEGLATFSAALEALLAVRATEDVPSSSAVVAALQSGAVAVPALDAASKDLLASLPLS